MEPKNKAQRRKKPTVTTTPAVAAIQKTELSFKIDDEKIKQIQECLKKGNLIITVDRINLSENVRSKAAYIYD